MNLKPEEIEENISYGTAGICRGLNRFRKEKLYCDVDIQIADMSYSCHKHILATSSKYFHAMFTSSFQEKGSNSVQILGDVDLEVIEDVIEFLYIADIKFTEHNAYGLLRTSCYLQIEELTTRTCDYILGNPNVDNLLKISEYLSKMERNDYVEIVTKHIIPKMRILRKSETFLAISHTVLSAILRNAKLCNWGECTMQEFVEAIFDWTKSNWTDRKCYLKDLMKSVVSSDDFSVSLLENFSDILSIKNETVSIPPLTVFCQIESGSSYSIDKLIYDKNSWVSKKRMCVSETPTRFKVIRFENSNYCLTGATDEENEFWRDFDEQNLAKPPIQTNFFNIAVIGETMFLYDFNEDYCPINTEDFIPGILNENDNAVYSYNFDLNRWFSIPDVQERLYHSYLAIIDKMLYLIGGSTDFRQEEEKRNILQFYDKRAGKWMMKSVDENILLNGTVGVFKNEIYIYEEPIANRGIFNVYNSVAGKFRPINTIYPFAQSGVIVSSNDELWYLEKKVQGGIYRILENEWKEVCKIPEKINTVKGYDPIDCIEDAQFF